MSITSFWCLYCVNFEQASHIVLVLPLRLGTSRSPMGNLIREPPAAERYSSIAASAGFYKHLKYILY